MSAFPAYRNGPETDMYKAVIVFCVRVRSLRLSGLGDAFIKNIWFA